MDGRIRVRKDGDFEDDPMRFLKDLRVVFDGDVSVMYNQSATPTPTQPKQVAQHNDEAVKRARRLRKKRRRRSS